MILRSNLRISRNPLGKLIHRGLTVEYDDCEDGEVEEDAGPRRGVDHGEDDCDHEYDDLDSQRPHDARRQRTSV